jgi:hypothetical protein
MADTNTTTITVDPHNGTPVFGGPEFTERVEYDPADFYGEEYPPTPASIGWDLSGGARINYGRHEDGGPLLVTLNLSDYALKTGIVQRIVTREQLVEHARHLLRLAGAELAVVLPEVKA